MRILHSLWIMMFLLFSACQSQPNQPAIQAPNTIMSIPATTQQLLRVTTADWNTSTGTLQRYERDAQGHWQKVGKPINIILGRNGLGWGLGLHRTPVDAVYIKHEGDGRAPAGLFVLGHGFGYDTFDIAFPYTLYRRTDHCVDDSHSQWYNQIVDSTKVEQDYKSFEYMRLKNNLYEYGITVNHNPDRIAQAGSCIFMHIRNPKGGATAGCTAMDKKDIVEILRWLREDKHPLLLQLPKEELERYIDDEQLKSS